MCVYMENGDNGAAYKRRRRRLLRGTRADVQILELTLSNINFIYIALYIESGHFLGHVTKIKQVIFFG